MPRLPHAERGTVVLAAAHAEFAEHGWAGTSMNAIAARAGVTKPVLYRHAADKDALYVACLRAAGDRLLDGIRRAMAAADATTAPAAVLRAIFATLEDDPSLWALLFDRSRPDEGAAAEAAADYEAQIAALGAEGVRALLGGLRDPADVEAAAAGWEGAVRALVAWWLAHPEVDAAAMGERTDRILAALLAA